MYLEVIGVLLSIVIAVYLIRDWSKDKKKEKVLLDEAAKKARVLTVGQKYHLFDEPLSTDLRLETIDTQKQWVSGTIIVKLPAGSVLANVQEKRDWRKFLITYKLDNKWYVPTWQFGWQNPVLLVNFWRVQCNGIEVEVTPE